MNYTHLIQHERYQIQCWAAAGVCKREIADRLQRHPSTINKGARVNIRLNPRIATTSNRLTGTAGASVRSFGYDANGNRNSDTHQ